LIKHDEPNVKIKKKVRKRKDVDKGEKVDTQITVKSESKSPGLKDKKAFWPETRYLRFYSLGLSPKFDLPRLKASLSQENYLAEPPKLTPILNPAKKKLTSSQFRYINEKLYTQVYNECNFSTIHKWLTF